MGAGAPVARAFAPAAEALAAAEAAVDAAPTPAREGDDKDGNEAEVEAEGGCRGRPGPSGVEADTTLAELKLFPSAPSSNDSCAA